MVLQGLSFATILLRLSLAALFGGIIGYERESSKHPAGLRTHMLICIGSALVMLTGQYVFVNVTPSSDPTRMAAQVISGIGFLGVGTIIIVGRQHVRGLTTAAGLWASACMGLAIGIGFYAGAIIGGVLILVIVTVLQRIDSYISVKSKSMDVYIEVDKSGRIDDLQTFFAGRDIHLKNIDMTKNPASSSSVGLTLYLKLSARMEHVKILTDLMKLEWVSYVQEI